MLETIRKHSASLLIKVLFSLLILSFLGWGVGDFISGRARVKVVAEVDGVAISPVQFDREYQREVGRLERMFGTKLDREQARALGLVDATMARIINETLYDMGARSMGVTASDGAIRASIEKDKVFQDQSGHFSRAQFEQVLASNGFTEQSYVALLRQELMRTQLSNTVEAGVTPPKSLIEAIYRFRAEKRVAETVAVADSAMTAIGQPSADDLTKFHADHPAQFTAPEYRQLTVISFGAKDLEGEVAVSDQEIRDLYAQRQDEFDRPEMRHLQQIVVQDEAKAKEIHTLLSEGRDFATVAKDAAGLDKETIDIGEVSNAMLLPELAAPAFALPDKGISEPVKSPLGWHILKVVSITPAHKETIDEARAALTADLKHEKAVDALYKMANKLEDTLGGGATLEEAAKTLNLPLSKIATVDATGHDPKGDAVGGLPAGGKFLQTAFETPENEDSLVTEAGADAYFVIHVDKVIPSAVRPLDTIRDQVAAAWTEAEREIKAKATAEALVKRLKEGADLGQIAGELGVKVVTTEPFTRAP
ncbi:MAG: SurA N-terminal domain-containing protein, partial [Rhodospirillales bacterium]